MDTEASYLISEIIPSLQILKIIGAPSNFKNWVAKHHPFISEMDLFEGYKFCINCCLNQFSDSIANDKSLKINNDFLLDNAISQIKPIHLVANSCEKTIFLKNIKPFIKTILKSKNYSELEVALKNFDIVIGSKFDFIFSECISIDSINLTRDVILNISLIDFAQTYLVQINNNGPTANARNVLSTEWLNPFLQKKYFEGYKFSVQFIYYRLLGHQKFTQSCVSKIHLATSWITYTCDNDDGDETSNNTIFDNLKRKYNLEEQNCIDCYYNLIEDEIITPIGQTGISPHIANEYFVFSDEKYSKNILFDDLLDESLLLNNYKATWGNKIEACLYWYPFELVNSETNGMFFGTPSFNVMLAGNVTLHNKEKSEFERIIVSKFTHPQSGDTKNNNYSYGILIDSKSAASHYNSGWIIYQNACNDFSGFSSREHRVTEKLINKYKTAGLIELKELTISLDTFKTYITENSLDRKELSIIEKNKLIPDLIQKSRAYLFELFTYYVCSNSPAYKGLTIELNAGKNSDEGEKDIVLSNENQVILIECKIDPKNCDMRDVIDKLKRKIDTFEQKTRSCQLWFWNQPSKETMEILGEHTIEGKPIKVITVSNSYKEPSLAGISIAQLKMIMRDYEPK
jgi:hypothetical protein